MGPDFPPALPTISEPPSLYEKVRKRAYLARAWHHVRKNARRSGSTATREAVASFGEDAFRQIELIQEQLRGERYSFAPAHGVPVDRGEKDPRPIVVHDVRDRVVQRSILEVLMDEDAVSDLVEHDNSFGGIPRIGVADAVEAACRAIEDGGAYYLRSDIKSFFAEIPRGRALEELTSVLPDDSLDEFLDEATRTELANREELGHLLEFFPDALTGVPQGHSLSALLGNVLLRQFDERMNEGPCVCLRYLDDFLVLGADRESVWATFRRGRELLASEGLEVYDPHESDKAEEGSTRTRFEFLGCDLSHGFVHPSRSNRRRLLDRVREKLETSKQMMMSGGFGGSGTLNRSLVSTLSEVSQILEAWSKHYRFCNATRLMDQMDARLDEMLRDYVGSYANRAGRASEDERRRMLGVWKLGDTEFDPILPLKDL